MPFPTEMSEGATRLVVASLKRAEQFISDELEHRRASFLPDPTDGEKGYIDEACEALQAVQAALEALR